MPVRVHLQREKVETPLCPVDVALAGQVEYWLRLALLFAEGHEPQRYLGKLQRGDGVVARGVPQRQRERLFERVGVAEPPQVLLLVLRIQHQRYQLACQCVSRSRVHSRRGEVHRHVPKPVVVPLGPIVFKSIGVVRGDGAMRRAKIDFVREKI